MISSRYLRKSFKFLLALSLVFLFASLSLAQVQAESPDYQPTVGQSGKDVIWVPTSLALTNRMLDVAKVTAQDYVIDLGSGDGRIVITAAKRGARALGIEYNPEMVALSQRNAQREGVTERAKFIHGDIFASDFSQATVLTMFLLPELNLKLRPTVLNMKPGTRVVSNSFDMGDWKPDHSFAVSREDGCENYCNGYFWVVPAKVEGIWRHSDGELALAQSYQKITGTLRSGLRSRKIAGGSLSGETITFEVEGHLYTGRVSGNTMRGTVQKGGHSREWQAVLK